MPTLHFKRKKRLVFAPAKHVDGNTWLDYRIDFCQLPLEAYKLETGLLINFGSKSLEFKRVTNEHKLAKQQINVIKKSI